MLVDVHGQPYDVASLESITCLRSHTARHSVLQSILGNTICHTVTDKSSDDLMACALNTETVDEHRATDKKLARLRTLLLHGNVAGENPIYVLCQLQCAVGGARARWL